MSEKLIANCIENLTNILCEELEEILEREKNRRNNRIWVRNWIVRRSSLGASCTLLQELRNKDIPYKNHLRMGVNEFKDLLSKISNVIQRQNTYMRNAIPARSKLELTLRFLTKGDSFVSLEFLYRIPRSTMCQFIAEACGAIRNALKGFIQIPSTVKKWATIEQGFRTKWNFPGCIGVIDGKHISIKAPPNCGSDFFNYKGFNSIVLLALVDDNYSFSYVDVGCNGRSCDGGIFATSSLMKILGKRTHNILTIYLVVGDEAFALKTYLMRSYPFRGVIDKRKRIFNYRLSRARRIVENAFGILASRFRILEKHIPLHPDKVDLIVIAICSIHNWLRKTSMSYMTRDCVDTEDINTGEIHPGRWRSELNNQSVSLPQMGSNHYSRKAEAIRSHCMDYFNGNGRVSWQSYNLDQRQCFTLK